jgi:hypothetical protein
MIGDREQFVRHVEAQRFRGLEVDDKLEFRWRADGAADLA